MLATYIATIRIAIFRRVPQLILLLRMASSESTVFTKLKMDNTKRS